MKDGVVIVNTARGAVIDEDALVKALDNGKVASAGLDVYEKEPHIHPGLTSNPHVLLLPHMGTWTVEVSRAMLSLSPSIVQAHVRGACVAVECGAGGCGVAFEAERLHACRLLCATREGCLHKGA
jgi:lactate dehydrogenase-like 2-hydroxyacid dehydrogenase